MPIVGGGYHVCVASLRLRVERLDELEVLELDGEVDLSTVDEFIQQLFELSQSGRARIILDLAPVSFIDSTVVNTLFASVARIRRAGGDLAIVCPNPDVRRVLEITGLDAVFRVVGTRAEAVSALTGRPAA